MINKLRTYFDISYFRAFSLLVLVMLIVLLTSIYYTLPYLYKPKPVTHAQLQALQLLAQQIQNDTTQKTNHQFVRYDTIENTSSKLFIFDPNTATLNDFKNLGLSEKLAHTIDNYRKKGGKFYAKENLKKIWGLKESTYARLAPYIHIEKKELTHYDNLPAKSKPIIELNTANLEQLNQLPMIGATLSQRIIDHRANLGGFYTKTQLKEVYGLPESTYALIAPQIKIDPSQLKKININTVLFQDLKLHPYFRNGLALSLLKYRREKGRITSWEELKQNNLITDTDFNKIKQYIIF